MKRCELAKFLMNEVIGNCYTRNTNDGIDNPAWCTVRKQVYMTVHRIVSNQALSPTITRIRKTIKGHES